MKLNALWLSMLFLFSIPANSFAQKEISGRITDQKDQPLESVTIVCKDSAGSIIQFTRTDKKGLYVIHLKSETKGYTLEVSSIGYKKIIIKVDQPGKLETIKMEQTALELKNVNVRNAPRLTLRGDTLIYNPADFADKQDRSIEDVLRKMPGIEIGDNGNIKYNGKSISNFYIDGDNLLDGRYNIASRTIPHDAVDKIQVIEKDQPIKMLRKNNMSEDVALNVVIKEGARLKMMGEIGLGAGLPGKYEEKLTGMVFQKKWKFINKLSANNTGIDPGVDLVSHTMEDLINQVENPRPSSFLHAGAAGVPMLPEKRTLFNNAGLLTLNNLYNLNPDWQLRLNAGFLADKRTLDYQKISATYLPGDTINYTENQSNIIKPGTLLTKFVLTGNADNYYIKNTLQFDQSWERTYSNLLSNKATANQFLKQKTTDFSNELNYRKKMKSGNMLNFSSFLGKSSQPERLQISPGWNESIFNNGLAFKSLYQNITLPTFFTNNYLATTFVNGRWMQTYKVGMNIQKQEFSTGLYKTLSDQNMELISPEFSNNLQWLQSKLYLHSTFQYKSDKLTSTITLPFSYNELDYKDRAKSFHNKTNRFFIDPSFRLKYMTGIENYVSLNYGYSQNLGGLQSVYSGIILTDYRSLTSNKGPLPESKINRVNAGYNYRKAIKMFFFNLGASYSETERNTLSALTLNNDVTQKEAIALPNEMSSIGLTGGISKYLFRLTTTVSGGIIYDFTRYTQLQNNQLLPFENQSITLNGKFAAKINKLVNWSWSINYTTQNNHSLKQQAKTNYKQMRQETGVSLLTFKNVYVNLSGQYIFSRQDIQPDTRYIFADANLKYTWVKLKTDFEFAVNNLGNIQRFEAIYLSANSFTSARYQIPGRTAILKATFSF